MPFNLNKNRIFGAAAKKGFLRFSVSFPFGKINKREESMLAMAVIVEFMGPLNR